MGGFSGKRTLNCPYMFHPDHVNSDENRSLPTCIENMATPKIRIPLGLNLIAGTIMEPDKPTAETLREHIFGLVLDDDDSVNPDVLRPLVNAYEALLIEGEEDDIEFVSDADDWAAEKLYRQFCIKGWREAVGRTYPEAVDSRTDEDVYEGCPWYEFGGKCNWPAQLIAEIGYLRGYKEGCRGVAMTNYVQAMEHKHGSEWWKKEHLG